MHQRCYRKNCKSYPRYGGRGITVCERWNSVHSFLEDMGHPPEGMTLGRINNDGNYEPSNCRWETQEQQNENTSRNRYVEWQGRSQTIKAWGQELNLNPRQISERLRRGWTVELTLTTPTPRGYEEGRRISCESSRSWWAKNARQCRSGETAPQARSQVKATPEVKERIQSLRSEGLTVREIAERVSVGKSTVANVLRAA